MPTVKSNPITFIDNSTNINLDLYVSSNLPDTQIRVAGSDTYTPSWEDTPLILTPSVYISNTQILLTDTRISVEWKRKAVGGEFTELQAGETNNNGILQVNQNILGRISGGIITYKCTVSYKNLTTIFKENSYSLTVSSNATGEEIEAAKFVTVSSDCQILVKEAGKQTYTPSSAILTAELHGGLTSYQWYLRANDAWEEIANASNKTYTVLPSNMSTKSVTYKCQSGDKYDTITITKIEEAESPLILQITSSNGNIFKNGNISTTLRAIVHRGAQDVTDEFDANQFIWTRSSNDAEGDKAWNDAHFGGSKTQIITAEDVSMRATFFCDLIDTTTRASLLG